MNRLQEVCRSGLHWIKNRSPEILLGVGLSGMAASVIFAIKDTPKAVKLLEEKKKEEGKDKLEPIEIIKTVWKVYIPTALTFSGGTACIIGSYSINHRRNAVLASAYSLADTALREYREKVIETIGEKKEKEIRDKVDEETLKKNPPSKQKNIPVIKGWDSDQFLCLDTISKRYFRCSIETIRQAVVRLNKQLHSDIFVSLNQFYSEIGLSPTTLGDLLGWDETEVYEIEVIFSYHTADTGETCCVIDFAVAPRYDYQNLH